MARLDRLAPVKEVAQVAAVIGREFSPRAAGGGRRAAASASSRTRSSSWSAAELVFRRGEAPGASYAFKHALVRDAAYQSLLKGRRRQLHAGIAAVLEERFPEIAAAEPELLARHYAGAGSAERAVEHWRRAAELAIGRSANLEAIAHCEQAEAQLQRCAALGRAGAGRARGPARQGCRGACRPRATPRPRPSACSCGPASSARSWATVSARCTRSAACGRSTTWPRAGGTRPGSRTGSTPPRRASRTASSWPCASTSIGVTLLFRGEPAGASLRLRERAAHYDEGDRDAHIRHSGHDAATLVRGHLVLAQWFLGLPEQALRTSRRGSGDRAPRGAPLLARPDARLQRGSLGCYPRDWAAAEALAAEAREISTRYGLATHLALGTIASGIAVAARGDAVEGARLIREGMAALHRTGGGFFTPLAMGHLALALCAGGDADAALEAADEAVRVTRASEELCWEAEALRVLGEVRRAAGAAAGEVEADLRAAVEIARRQEASAFELRAATSLGRLWAAGGERRKAYDMLAAIHGRFAEGLDTADLRDARALLDALR